MFLILEDCSQLFFVELNVEQWLIDMIDLMRAAWIPKEDQLEVTKIQLKNIARTWWLAEEARLEKLISWDQF